jgi:hypothetical protein
MHNVIANIEEFYPEITDPKHMKIKIYSAFDRTNVYIANKFLDNTYYSFDLDSLFNKKDRKSLIKIINGCEDLTYKTVHHTWYMEGLRELFYEQKEDKRISEKLARICVLVRNNTQKGFVKVVGDKISIVTNISDATEFLVASESKDELAVIKSKYQKHFKYDNLKAFFNPKMVGRNLSA